jgi:DNA-binding PadR family transcriptional regulator
VNRPSLGDLERIVLLCVVRLGDGTYGAEIQREILDRTGRDVTPGTVYPTLDRLERKGLVRSWIGEPTAERGGRAKRHYALLAEGLRMAGEVWAEQAALAEGIEDRLREAAGGGSADG